MNTRRNSPLLAGIVTAIVLAVSVASYFLPFSNQAIQEGAYHSRLMFTVTMAAAMCGAAILFLRGVTAFKPALQSAYRWFAAGLILFAVSLLQWPIAVVFGLSDDSWALSGAIIIPFILATAFMYVGMRRFALTLQVRTFLVSRKTAGAIVAMATALSAVAAHYIAVHDVPGAAADSYTAAVAWTLSFGLLAWVVALRIRQSIGAEYQEQMNWLIIALGALNVSGLHEYVTSYFLDESDAYIYLGISLVPFVVAGFLFLRAGYLFSLGPTVHMLTPGEPAADTGNRAYFDSITAIAALASRPADIDPLLDRFREITATIPPGTTLSADQQEQLARTYIALEHYLLTADPLRSFTKEQLREYLSPVFRVYVEGLEQLAGNT